MPPPSHRAHGEHLSVPSFEHEYHRSPSPNSILSRKLDISPKKHRRASAPLQIVFLGIAIRERGDVDDGGPEYALVVSDGSGIVQSEHNFRPKGTTCEQCLEYLLDLATKYSKQRGHKVQIVSLAQTCANLAPKATFSVDAEDGIADFLTRVWLKLDSIPFLASSAASERQFSLDAQAGAALDEALSSLVPMSSSTVKVALSPLRQVLVDADFRIHLYSLKLLKSITSPALWHAFTILGQALALQKTSVAFFSATSRGGGVALMVQTHRSQASPLHSLMRIWNAVGMDAGWYVPIGDSSVFNITKRKFHNVLQGVADKEIMLTEEDQELFESWTDFNFKRFWADEDSPIRRLDIAIIDDPQLTALIPIIRRESPRTKIVFRSHIQIRADLIDKGEPQQKKTWDYLWGFIKQADLFVAHPVEEFVPQVVKDSMPVVYMPRTRLPNLAPWKRVLSLCGAASTDPLDGLNKPITRDFLHMYRHTFDKAVEARLNLFANKNNRLNVFIRPTELVDWSRGYILQVARFDPSKGIPDLAEGYRRFREEASQKVEDLKHMPQLIMTGHSSVDDPDGTLVLHKLHEQLGDKKFDQIRDDIHAIRAPPSDRLLNAMLRGADVVCQVSTREGYEIKVSEAIHKGKWVIATKAGGIPLQIRDGIDGQLVEPNDPEGIALALLSFYSSDKLKRSRSELTQNDIAHVLGGRFSDDGAGPSERDLSLGNATMWHFLWSRLCGISDHVQLTDEQRSQLDKFGIDCKGPGMKVDDLNGKKVWELLVQGMEERKKHNLYRSHPGLESADLSSAATAKAGGALFEESPSEG
ncbi:SPOSA6832_03785 [Sporobolomyces salmonicolor]|uniref:SPOSA6832_03785-mRNA-1:cds n=1 Tax=Sporidiobolus salmonicolor TaxID=5005 RepID=A0A0D6EQ95_SPOSA|nr:SPOSA6832_03785 [Sporobolomyces salmonicolor]